MVREFKEFLLRGNVVDLAVAVVIGTAFGAVVASAVDDLLMPVIAMIFGEPDFSALDFEINDALFRYGNFITVLITFALIAAAVFFFVVKPVNYLIQRSRREPPPDPTVRKCPECLSDIPVAARRCAFCTAEVGAAA
jgi:large conductance mechanosensitive channel